MRLLTLAAFAATLPIAVVAQVVVPAAPPVTTPVVPTAQTVAIVPVAVVPAVVTLPAETMLAVTPVSEITSKKMKEGDKAAFQVANDITYNNAIVIPRGSPVAGTITWHTGRGIGGKSAKYEVTFDTVSVAGRTFRLRGKHRQEGKGNTVAALLGSMLISGKSAVMVPGQLVNAFTAEPITL